MSEVMVMTYIYEPWPNGSFGVGFVPIGLTLLELWPFENFTTIFNYQGHGQSQMPGVNFRALGQPYPLVLVSGWSLERFKRWRINKQTDTQTNKTNTILSIAPIANHVFLGENTSMKHEGTLKYSLEHLFWSDPLIL